MDNDKQDDDADDDKVNTRGMTAQAVPRYQDETHAATEAGDGSKAPNVTK